MAASSLYFSFILFYMYIDKIAAFSCQIKAMEKHNAPLFMTGANTSTM
jgi:hypothetical protein